MASAASTPGSGAVAAGLGALGAGLVSMASTGGEGEGAGTSDQAPYAEGRASELGALRRRLLELVDEDAAAYAAWIAARAAPEGDAAALDKARRAAVGVPVEVMEQALAALRIAAAGAPGVRAGRRTDLRVGARALRAAVECGGEVVLANLRAAAPADGPDELRRIVAWLLGESGRLAGLVLDGPEEERP